MGKLLKIFLILQDMEQLGNKHFDCMIVSAENFTNISCSIKYYANIYFLSVCGHTHLCVHVQCACVCASTHAKVVLWN